MSWKELNDQALKALMDGDNDQAIRIWRSCIKEIEETPGVRTVSMGQAYYYLAKCLVDAGETIEPTDHFLTAERIVMESEPGNAILKQIKYDLGQQLKRTGRNDDAVHRIRHAKGMVAEPLAECLQGESADDLDINGIIKELKRHGLARKLTARKLASIQKNLVDAGKASEDDLGGIHPFDVLFEYYHTEKHRIADNCVLFNSFSDVDLQSIIADLNEMVGSQLVSLTNTRAGDSQIVVTIEAGEDQPRASKIDKKDMFYSLIKVYNYTLMESGDRRRYMRLASYDDREAAMLLTVESASKLFLAGAQEIFEDASKDLEPDKLDVEEI